MTLDVGIVRLYVVPPALTAVKVTVQEVVTMAVLRFVLIPAAVLPKTLLLQTVMDHFRILLMQRKRTN